MSDLRLAPPALAAWGAAWLVTSTPSWAAPVTVVGWTSAAVLAVLLLARSGWPRPSRPRSARSAAGLRSVRAAALGPSVLLSVAAVALIATSVGALGHLRHPDLAVQGPRQGAAEFTVTGVPKLAPTAFGGPPAASGAPVVRIQIEATMERFTAAGRSTQARAPTLVFVAVDEVEAMAIGSRFRASGSLVGLEPGDSREFLFFARGEAIRTAPAPGWLGAAEQLRTAFRRSAADLPGDGALLLPGLAIGDDRAVTDDLREAMTVTGLTHLTAVSGANCAVVVAAVMLLGAALGLRRGVRIGLAIAVLVGFVVLVTPEPSVLRAGTMAVIVLVALAGGRPASGLPALALSVVVLLALDPWLAGSAGFILSVLATAGLLLFTRPIARLAARVMPRVLATALAVPIAAHLACQPVLLLLSPQLTLYTVPANLLADPAAALVSVLGLLVCLLGVVAPDLAAATVWVPWLPAAWIGAVARFFAAAPVASIPVPDSAVAAVVTVAVTVLALVALFARRAPRVLRRFSAGVAVVALLLGTGVTVGSTIARETSVPGDWQLAACDIGQGDAVLVRSAGRIALVDVGPDPDPLAACFDRLHITRIDLLVLTHFDLDHVGGLDAVLGRVDRALVGPTDGAADERLVARLRDAGAEVVDARRGLGGELGGERWDVLWPRPGTPLRGNDASVTVRFGGELQMLFLGDLGEQAQDAVRAAGLGGTVDVVKVAHHGSADQSDRLYAELDAAIGIISVGAENRYGHPTDRLLALLARVGTRPFRTDRGGLVVLSAAPARPGSPPTHTVWTERTTPP
ncbi:MAG: ComEC/Rec2 family competence protein [Herbiconiux sp.]|nr:ComEC/Rec2 family competence protein [Herbiconiux sp.]